MATGDSKYRAPEGRIEAKSDVWALGAAIYELVHRQPLGISKPRPMPKEYSGKLNRIMMDCLLTRPEERISSRSMSEREEPVASLRRCSTCLEMI